MAGFSVGVRVVELPLEGAVEVGVAVWVVTMMPFEGTVEVVVEVPGHPVAKIVSPIMRMRTRITFNFFIPVCSFMIL